MGVANCLDAKTGDLLWSRDILKDFSGKLPKWNYAMSPFVDGGRVILIPGGPEASVVALDRNTGATIWKSGGDVPGYATPQKVTINGKAQYLIYSGNYLSGLDPADGKQLWNFKWETRSGVNAAAPIVMGNKVFITSSYNHGCALVEVTPEGAKGVWENKELPAHFSSPILVKDHIYGVGDPGQLTCIDPKTGKALWKQDGFEKGPKMMIDGVLLIFDGKGGDLVMVDPSPDAYEELGRFKPLGDQSWTAPIISNGKMIVRNKSALACYSLK
jgi:outer membrane protein assembly factor BamB